MPAAAGGVYPVHYLGTLSRPASSPWDTERGIKHQSPSYCIPRLSETLDPQVCDARSPGLPCSF